MNKTLMIVLTAAITFVPTIAAAVFREPVQVPEPTTAMLLLGAAGAGAVVAGLKRFRSK
jgi:hypothetical protein